MAQRKETPKERLAKRAEELEELREAEQETAFVGDQREATGESSMVRQHPADIADFTYQRELQQTTQELLDREVQQVEDALRRQAEGTYGTCESCGRKIPAERLRARPEATMCVDCQREREVGGAGA